MIKMHKTHLLLILLLPQVIYSGFLQIDESNVNLFFHSRSNILIGKYVNTSDPTSLSRTSFSPKKETFIYSQGYFETILLGSSLLVVPIILSKYDVNVFVVDYDKVSTNILYPYIVHHQLEEAAKILANKIQDLVVNHGLNLSKTTLAGESLGAQLSGAAGTFLKGQAAQAIGLDPAGPLFKSQITSNRLTVSSAQRVEAIHTSANGMGYYNPTAHADFYINGGRRQPTCGGHLDLIGVCSHFFSLFYYVESILKGGFIGTKCDSYENYTNGLCENGKTAYMGEYFLDKGASGTYYVKTNLLPPFAKN